MKFFIDTANIEEIKKGVALGMVDGVTTNPSLIARENRPFEELLQEICDLVDGPVNGEAVSLDAEGMVGEGRTLAAFPKACPPFACPGGFQSRFPIVGHRDWLHL